MRRRRIWLGLVASMLVALMPLAAYAAKAQQFSASGDLVQTSKGTGTLGASGLETLNQQFKGSLDESNWGAIKKANVSVLHNSLILADVPTLAVCAYTFPDCTTEVPLFGRAWGTFSLSKGGGNSLTGRYEANILGVLRFNPMCPPNAAVGLPLEVEVTDTGGWEVVSGSTHGSFKQINDTGTITVEAAGCLGQESAQLVVSGSRLGG